VEALIEQLRGQWPLPDSRQLRDEVLTAYAEPSRRYHNIDHLHDVLDRLSELARHDTAFDQLPVLLAAWFHDVVYDGAPTDEQRSAEHAQRCLAGLVHPETSAEIIRLVRLTETHRPKDNDPNGSALCDADLAILAAPADRYRAYTQAVRAEYRHVAEADFRAGRAKVLRALLDKPHLFHTRHARERWEHTARSNLNQELAVLVP
jgi:predicted metal-dependent HD superfamily phosphohydrolase